MSGATQTINKDGLSQDVLDYIEGLEGENDNLAKALDEATDELVKSAETDLNDTSVDDVTKGLPDEVAAIVKGIMDPIVAENKTLRETVDGERDIRLTAEQIAKAGTFGFGDTAELGEVLKSVNAACGADIYEKLTKNLDAASAIIKESGMFIETGSTAEGIPSSDIAKASSLNAAAAEMISKGTATTTSDALRKLAVSNPDLFTPEGN